MRRSKSVLTAIAKEMGLAEIAKVSRQISADTISPGYHGAAWKRAISLRAQGIRMLHEKMSYSEIATLLNLSQTSVQRIATNQNI